MSDLGEQRSDPRLRENLEAHFSWNKGKKDARSFVLDLSLSGFRAISRSPLPEKEQLAVIIHLWKLNEGPIGPLLPPPPSARSFEGTARIIWQRPWTAGMWESGCQFIEVSPDSQSALIEFVREVYEDELETSSDGD